MIVQAEDVNKNSLPEELKQRLSSKRLVFTVTTGRSGTGYLARMLDRAKGVTALHEPEPKFSDVFRGVQDNQESAYNFWIDRKLPTLASTQNDVYIETSHLYCKGFVESLIDIGIIPDLIILRRPYREVATSMYQLGTIPGRTKKGLMFYLSPNDNSVLEVPGWESLHDYQLCFWYCLEIERRMRAYKPIFENYGALVAEVTLSEIITSTGFRILLNKLHLPGLSVQGWMRYYYERSQKINVKRNRKRSKSEPFDKEGLEAEIELILDKSGYQLSL